MENGLHIDEANRRELDGNFLVGNSTHVCFSYDLKKDVSPAILAILRISSVEKLRISRDELSLMSTQIILSWISLKRVPWYLQWKPPDEKPDITCTFPKILCTKQGKFPKKTLLKLPSSYHLFLSIMNAPFCEDIPHDVTTLTRGLTTGCRGEYGASFIPIQPGAAILYPSNSRSWRPKPGKGC